MALLFHFLYKRRVSLIRGSGSVRWRGTLLASCLVEQGDSLCPFANESSKASAMSGGKALQLIKHGKWLMPQLDVALELYTDQQHSD